MNTFYLKRRTALPVWLLAVALLGGCASAKGARNGAAPSAARVESARAGDGLPFLGSSRRHRVPPPSAEIDPNVVGYPDYNDPLIYLNRATFAFNDVVYRFLFIPVAKGYAFVTPDSIERGIGNFFFNIKTPIHVVNHLLQLKPKPLGRSLLRFGINSTVGVLGFFDPAKAWFDLEREEAHLEDTLARYGAGYGFYLVIPLLGPSDLRHGLSSVADHFLNPITYLTDDPLRTGINAADQLQDFAPRADQYGILREKSEDAYLFFRNLYLQKVQRDADY